MDPYTPPPVRPAEDRVTLYGLTGLAAAVCCPPGGAVLGVLSIVEAGRVGKRPALGYLAIGLCVLSLAALLIAAFG